MAHPKACRAISVLLIASPLAAALALMFAPRPAPANLWTPSAVGGDGTSVLALSAPSYTATAGSGSNGFAISTNGARIDFGAGANDYCTSDGTTISCFTTLGGTSLVAGGGSGTAYFNTHQAATAAAAVVNGSATNGAAAVGSKIGNANTLSTAGAEILRFCQDTATTCASPVAGVKQDGALVQTGVTQANLGTPANGTIIYCSDCTIANPCAGGGTGAFAKRLNGAWVCN